MPLTRREFLTKLATIAVVVPILPKLIGEVAPAVPEMVIGHLADSVFQPSPSLLSIAMMEEAYQTCVFGYDEPDIIQMSQNTYVQFIQIFDQHRLPRYIRPDGDIELPYFNGASVMPSKGLPKDSWIMLNSSIPKEIEPKYHERFSGMFYTHDPKWHPIPKEL